MTTGPSDDWLVFLSRRRSILCGFHHTKLMKGMSFLSSCTSSFFGGEKSFEENKKRDERKRMLFKENNAFLIEVREGFDFEILCEEINSIIIKN